jgi:hypothetical protein
MAAKPIIISSREVDLAVSLTASSEIISLPVSFLQNKRPFKVWRAQSVTDEYIIVRLRAAKAINAAAFVNPNFSSVRIVASATLGGLAAPSYDTGIVSIWPGSGKPVDEDHRVFTGLCLFANTIEYEYWKIYPSNYDAGATNAEFGRLMLDEKFQFTRDIDSGFALQFDSKDDAIVTDYNSLFTDPRGETNRNYAFPISAVVYDDVKNRLYGLTRYLGKAKDFVFCASPDATTDIHLLTLQATFSEMPSFKLQSMWHGSKRTWNTGFALREVQ